MIAAIEQSAVAGQHVSLNSPFVEEQLVGPELLAAHCPNGRATCFLRPTIVSQAGPAEDA